MIRMNLNKYPIVSGMMLPFTKKLNYHHLSANRALLANPSKPNKMLIARGNYVGGWKTAIVFAPPQQSSLLLGGVAHTCGRQQPSVPSGMPHGLPDKEQIEKYFFRTVAFIWDVSYWIFKWTNRNFVKYVVHNPTVQMYWKLFLDKMEKSRKN